MSRRPARSTHTDTLIPYTTLFRSAGISVGTYVTDQMRVKPFTIRSLYHEAREPLLDRVLAYQPVLATPIAVDVPGRSEEHTSELQSLMRISYAVFCLTKKQSTSSTMNNNPQQSKYNKMSNTK